MSAARGFTAIPNHVLRDSTLPPSTRLLYGVIASYAWGHRVCTASCDTLCEETGIGRSAFFEGVAALKDRKLIEVQKRKSKNGWRNVYVPVLKGVEIDGIEEEGRPEVGPRVVRDPDEGSSATRTQKKTKGEEASESDDSEDAREDVPATVWDFYLSVMRKRPRVLPAAERRIIAEALKAAEPLVEDDPERERAAAKLVCFAIRGCERSDFHMKRGRYAGRDGQVHNKLSQILKGKRGGRTTSEQIEFFAEIAGRSGVGAGLTSADPAKVRQEQVHVRTGLAPGATEHLRKRGKEAADWLAQHGIESVFDGRGGVRFATRPGGTS